MVGRRLPGFLCIQLAVHLSVFFSRERSHTCKHPILPRVLGDAAARLSWPPGVPSSSIAAFDDPPRTGWPHAPWLARRIARESTHGEGHRGVPSQRTAPPRWEGEWPPGPQLSLSYERGNLSWEIPVDSVYPFAIGGILYGPMSSIGFPARRGTGPGGVDG